MFESSPKIIDFVSFISMRQVKISLKDHLCQFSKESICVTKP